MTVTATLVIGRDGSTAKSGNSRLLSTPEDRQRFLELHRSADAIIVGSRTIESDPYAASKCPVYVFTRNSNKTFPAQFRKMLIDEKNDLTSALRKIKSIHSNTVIEAGPTLLLALIETGLVDFLHLSVTPITGGENSIDVEALLSRFNVEEDKTLHGTRLLKCGYKGHSTNS